MNSHELSSLKEGKQKFKSKYVSTDEVQYCR